MLQKILLTAVTASIVFLTASPLFAQSNHFWNQPNGGNWANPTNWQGGVPGNGDVAFFRLADNGVVIINGLTPSFRTPQSIFFNDTSNSIAHTVTELNLLGVSGFLFPANVVVGANPSRTAQLTISGSGTFGDLNTTIVDVNAGSNITITGSDVFARSTVNSGTISVSGGKLTTEGLNNLSGGFFSHTGGEVEIRGGVFNPNRSVYSIQGFGGGVAELSLTQGAQWNQNVLNLRSNGLLSIVGNDMQTSINTINVNLDVFDTTSGLSISDGGELEVAGALTMASLNSTARGKITINGRDASNRPSFLRVTGETFIGSRGTGEINITNGGEARFSNHVRIGYLGGSVGTLHVDGANSRAIGPSSRLLIAGENGTGEIKVTDGGFIGSQNIQLGVFGGSMGTLTIEGAGSQVSTRTIAVGTDSAVGRLYVRDNGQLRFASELRIGGRGTAVFEGDIVNASFTISNRGGGQLEIGGSLDLDRSGLLSKAGGSTTIGSLNIGNGTLNHSNGLLTINGGAFTENHADYVIEGAGGTNHSTLALINGAAWDRSSSLLAVGGSGVGSLNIESGAVVSNGIGVVGRLAGSDGSHVTVSGAGSRWDNSERLEVGQTSNVSMSILDGGVVTSARGEIGEGASSTSDVTVNGAGSKWEITATGTGVQVNGNLLVGEFGSGTLNIQNGGMVSANSTAVATQSGSTGVVNISGSSSAWENVDSLWVGGGLTATGGDALVNIDGGLVTADNLMKVRTDGLVNFSGGTIDVGTLDLTDPSASDNFNMTGGTLIADMILGDFIQEGGVLAPGDSPGVTEIVGDFEFESGEIEFEIGGLVRETEFDAIEVSGLATLDGVIDVNLVNGFTPNIGDQFDVFDGTIDSNSTFLFDFTDAQLGSGLTWDTSQFQLHGILQVAAIPEPGAMTLLAVTLAGLAFHRRRTCR